LGLGDVLVGLEAGLPVKGLELGLRYVFAALEDGAAEAGCGCGVEWVGVRAERANKFGATIAGSDSLSKRAICCASRLLSFSMSFNKNSNWLRLELCVDSLPRVLATVAAAATVAVAWALVLATGIAGVIC
jgi:hypothetical protein